uniref:hypothetical protein n=1 Tax=Pseudomonas laurentiana TaxID=2364649 RepID=UPI0029C7EBB4|nr:hypothetical protein [Pseudomonas laurentiana]
MNTLTIEGWCKTSSEAVPIELGQIHFHVSGADHVRLEQAEEQLKKNNAPEVMVDVDISQMELIMPPECGPLSDCQFRVYLSARDQRGQFHLVGHRATDGALVYSNAVMVDQLG